MATLQKFKHLATQCAVSGALSPSPTTSPVIHLRRRKTLRMLLSRTSDHQGHNFRRRLPRREQEDPPEKKVRRKLRDLFVSSPPPDEEEKARGEGGVGGATSPAAVGSGGGSGRRRALRPISATFRYRLLRRAWRPVLVTIPE